MPSATIERVIHASPETVFDTATNVHEWQAIVPAIEKLEVLTPGPVGVGTRFRETRRMFKREATEEMEFVEFERGKRYALLAESHGARYETTFTLTPEGDSTRLSMLFDATPLTRMAKVMTFLTRPLMGKMAEMCGKDLDAIKAHIEAQA